MPDGSFPYINALLMHHRLLKTLLLIVLAAFLGLGWWADRQYQYVIQNLQRVQEEAIPCSVFPYSPAEPEWDRTATLPGTGVSFRYPHYGFYGNVPTAEVSQWQRDDFSGTDFIAASVTDAHRPNEGPGNAPSFSVGITVQTTIVTESDLYRASAITDKDHEDYTTKRIENVNGRNFFLEEGGYDRHMIRASTIHDGQLVEVDSTMATFRCDFDPQQEFNHLMLDFLRHMEFGSPSAE
jgi:hypothetical protein